MAKPKTMTKLRDLASRAGRWLGLQATAAHTGAVESDRFDEMTWREIAGQAAAVRELIEDLGERHDYAADLIRDMFLAAYKASPVVRPAADMDPSRLVNRQAIAGLLESPEFAELRRETVGDPYASAMAVLAQAGAVRRMLEQAKEAQQATDEAAKARQEQQDAAQAVSEALEQAAAQAGEDGSVPDEAAEAVQQASARAEQADERAQAAAEAASQTLAGAAPGMRATGRAGAQQAAESAREEAALMAAWGVGPGELQRMDFQTRRRLAQRLRSGRLAQFIDLIGRFRQMAAGQRARKMERVPGELVGIETGDDLGRLIPSELAALGVPAMRAVFAARYAEGRLFVYEQRGETEAGQGAIICCVDCSGSMGARLPDSGVSGEAWAKACALAMLDQARAARRDFAGILFSSAGQIKVFRFPASQPVRIADVLDFTEFFWNGGTNFEEPLAAAAGLLEAEYNADGKMRGDIALISDGVCGVTEEWMRTWNQRKAALGFRVFGIQIGRAPGAAMDALSDNVRSIEDLAETEGAAGIFRVA
jgi:uncharacterized protein with von Willebrand factor type A (vWA) domain